MILRAISMKDNISISNPIKEKVIKIEGLISTYSNNLRVELYNGNFNEDDLKHVTNPFKVFKSFISICISFGNNLQMLSDFPCIRAKRELAF